LQLSHAVPQPTDLPFTVGSSQTASDRSVRGPFQETTLQSLDLRVKNAQKGKFGKISLRGTLHRLNDLIIMKPVCSWFLPHVIFNRL
jgi:hypothetical protein